MSVPTTQTQHPWRATVRTVFAFVVGLAATWALVIEAAGVDQTGSVVAATVAVAAGVTRVMAIPQVNDLIKQFAPWLAPAPRKELEDDGKDVPPLEVDEHGTPVNL